VYRSVDAGETWEQVYGGGILGAPVIGDGHIAWLLDGNRSGLIVSRDGGQSFDRSASLPGARSETLVELPNGMLAALGSGHVVVTPDLGQTWESIGPPLPFEPVGVAYSPARSALYIWTFTCGFTEAGNPVLPESILQLEITLDGE
jgi:hypothetical protein